MDALAVNGSLATTLEEASSSISLVTTMVVHLEEGSSTPLMSEQAVARPADPQPVTFRLERLGRATESGEVSLRVAQLGR
jgi:hypothetical protein